MAAPKKVIAKKPAKPKASKGKAAKPKAAKGKASKGKKDDKPKVKRAPGPYMIFCKAERPKIVKGNPNMPFGEVGGMSPRGTRRPAAGSAEELRLALIRPLGMGAVFSFGIGSSCWCLEMTFCSRFGAPGGRGLLPWVWKELLHGVWHAGAALGAHLLGQLLLAMWVAREGHAPRLAWLGVPVVIVGKGRKRL